MELTAHDSDGDAQWGGIVLGHEVLFPDQGSP